MKIDITIVWSQSFSTRCLVFDSFGLWFRFVVISDRNVFLRIPIKIIFLFPVSPKNMLYKHWNTALLILHEFWFQSKHFQINKQSFYRNWTSYLRRYILSFYFLIFDRARLFILFYGLLIKNNCNNWKFVMKFEISIDWKWFDWRGFDWIVGNTSLDILLMQFLSRKKLFSIFIRITYIVIFVWIPTHFMVWVTVFLL